MREGLILICCCAAHASPWVVAPKFACVVLMGGRIRVQETCSAVGKTITPIFMRHDTTARACTYCPPDSFSLDTRAPERNHAPLETIVEQRGVG